MQRLWKLHNKWKTIKGKKNESKLQSGARKHIVTEEVSQVVRRWRLNPNPSTHRASLVPEGAGAAPAGGSRSCTTCLGGQVEVRTHEADKLCGFLLTGSVVVLEDQARDVWMVAADRPAGRRKCDYFFSPKQFFST